MQEIMNPCNKVPNKLLEAFPKIPSMAWNVTY